MSNETFSTPNASASCEKTCLSAAAARAVDDDVKATVQGLELIDYFRGAGHVTQAAQGMRGSSRRDDVRIASLFTQITSEIEQGALVFNGALGVVHVKLCAHHAAQQNVTDLPVASTGVPGPAKMQEGTFKAGTCGGSGRLASVVGLNRTGCHQCVGSLPQSVTHQEFPLPRLVTTTGQSCQVVPFDPEIDANLASQVS